ncbi:hypothetical protein IM40_09795 (plasmid) [Candidatus Paracaedimonas acanthamoebae]|nr:hypothetical protein IM40_09795 [Candidatus Paracaedimonas acanthamoebae]
MIFGCYGYKKNLNVIVILNDHLTAQGNEGAIERKIKGLACGEYGYKISQKAAIIFIDALVEQGMKCLLRRNY